MDTTCRVSTLSSYDWTVTRVRTSLRSPNTLHSDRHTPAFPKSEVGDPLGLLRKVFFLLSPPVLLEVPIVRLVAFVFVLEPFRVVLELKTREDGVVSQTECKKGEG